MAQNKIKNKTLISILNKNRDSYNLIFRKYKLIYPNLESEDFVFYLEFYLESFFIKNGLIEENSLEETCFVIYEKILELISKNIIGNKNRFPEFEIYFSKILELPPELIIENPEKFFTYFSNLIINLIKIKKESLAILFETLHTFIKQVQSQEELFYLVNILVWVSGISSYRDISLELIPKLNNSLIRKILSLETDEKINEIIEKLKSNIWFSLKLDKSSIPIFKLNGNIILGGDFISTPEVFIFEDEIIARDLVNTFILKIDFYGNQFIRTKVIDIKKINSSVKLILPAFILKYKKSNLNLSEISEKIKSFVETNSFICFTLEDSYSVFVINKEVHEF